jgi:hypothetical protein
MMGWGVLMTILAILTILSATDAPAINEDNTLFIIINAVVMGGSVVKGLLLKVDAVRVDRLTAAAPQLAAADANA